MPETIEKNELVGSIQNGYNQFETLIAPLNDEQMTTPGVNGSWSVKDHIAHLTVWQDYLQSQLQGMLEDREPPKFMPGLSEDEINEGFFQQSQDRPLIEVIADFRLSYQRVLATLQSMSEVSINAPIPWSKSENASWDFIADNTYEHYKEHGNLIRGWLSQQ
jgi:hypothetical protein